jgi:hypothetical protein
MTKLAKVVETMDVSETVYPLKQTEIKKIVDTPWTKRTRSETKTLLDFMKTIKFF